MIRRKLLLIGIDGLRVDDALRRSPAGSAPPLAPILSACASAGTMLTMTMEVPTISGPGWSSLLTGAAHAEHSVFDNSFRGHTLERHLDLLSRAYIADTFRRTFAASSWPPIVDPAGPGPIIASRPDQARTGQHRVVVRDGETYGYRWADGEIAACARLALREAGPDVSFVSLGEVDEAGHLYGGSSPRVRGGHRPRRRAPRAPPRRDRGPGRPHRGGGRMARRPDDRPRPPRRGRARRRRGGAAPVLPRPVPIRVGGPAPHRDLHRALGGRLPAPEGSGALTASRCPPRIPPPPAHPHRTRRRHA
ncbi:alkaline phosphatase family protein [Leifsonia xyli]|uniref:alkaline phosphatase family protein n=1 Tax=Leifsonia xyli TaxID=1575 RepID=UPI00191C3DFD